VLCAAYGVVTFWHKNIGEKGVRKMLLKLTPGINFINFFCMTVRSAFDLEFFWQ